LIEKIISTNAFWRNNIFFLLIFIGMAAVYYDGVLNQSPLNEHQWRQTDCLSLTHNYAENAHFFSPELHNLLADQETTGKSAGEFPILYWVVGNIWKLTGESYFVYRVFYLMILLLGVLAVFNSFLIMLKDWVWSSVLTLLLFTSPVFVFYGVSFLTDIPAMCFVFLAGYFLLLYHKKGAWRFLLFAFFFFALAGLIKISSLIAFVVFGSLYLLERISVKTLGKEVLFKRPRFAFIGFLLVVVSIFSWYYYAYLYNQEHEFLYTFNNIYPYWLMDQEGIDLLLEQFSSHTSYLFLSRPLYLLLGLMGTINLFLIKKIPPIAYIANLLVLTGCFVYAMLWAPLLGIHDYYFGALLIVIPGISLPFAWYIRTNFPKIFESKYTKVLLSLFLVYNFFACANIIRIKTDKHAINLIQEAKPTFYQEQGWFNWDNGQWKRFVEMKPYIREIGIRAQDKVIVLSDPSFSISLYYLNQKGWTNYLNYDQASQIDHLINKGAKYLFIFEPDIKNKEFLKPFLKDSIGDYKNIRIFKLH